MEYEKSVFVLYMYSGKYLLNRAVAKINQVLPEHNTFCRQILLPSKGQAEREDGKKRKSEFRL